MCYFHMYLHPLPIHSDNQRFQRWPKLWVSLKQRHAALLLLGVAVHCFKCLHAGSIIKPTKYISLTKRLTYYTHTHLLREVAEAKPGFLCSDIH